MPAVQSIPIDSPLMRSAGRDALSVAIMDARNRTLALYADMADAAEGATAATGDTAHIDPPLWTLGHIGWFQEWWIARNLQRHLGAQAPAAATRLPSVHDQADACWDARQVARAQRWSAPPHDAADVRAYLLATMESTLELLDKAGDDDAALYFYRLALLHEDMACESLLEAAQVLGRPLKVALPGPLAQRAPLFLSAMPFTQGVQESAGFHFDNEWPAHPVPLPECEIDAQPVCWAQFVEFVDDGGYDHAALWHPDGWAWLQGHGAGGRAPRFVEQISAASGAVLQSWFGTPRRLHGAQPVLHVSWWEADAWCRWAGRRLPSEVEWERAACMATRQGFRWGDVWEWTGTTFGPYPGFVAGPWLECSVPYFGRTKVLRGASFATPGRLRNPRQRRFAVPGTDTMFCGFRSCAL